jgi:hypothetical protein
MSFVSAGPAGEDDEEGAQAFTATGDDVVRNLVDQGDGALEARADDAVDGFEIRLNERPDFFEGHRHWEQSVTGGIHNEPHILADAGGGENGEGGRVCS